MSKKETLDSVRKISIFEIKKSKLLNPLAWGVTDGILRWSVNGNTVGKMNFDLNFNLDNKYSHSFMHFKYRAKYSLGGGWNIFEDRIELIKVDCPFGGYRWFFKCGYNNGKYCGKKVAILYMVRDHFMCRHCAGLSYDSSNENKKNRGSFLDLSLGKNIEGHSKLKRYYYSGKPTRKHNSYLKKMDKYICRAISKQKKKAIINYTEMI